MISLRHTSLLALCVAGLFALSAWLGTVPAQAQPTLAEKGQDHHDGFFYSFWHDEELDEGSDVSFSLLEDGRYQSEWTLASGENWVGGKGWETGTDRTVRYEGTYDIGPEENSYLALYGWMRGDRFSDRLIEYYIIESYGSYNPANCGEESASRGSLGTFRSDGATYEIVHCKREDQPSIEGERTFDQYYSVRQPKKGFGRISGTITTGNHFDEWREAGLPLGDEHDYQIMATEGYESTGRSDITVAEVVFDARSPFSSSEPTAEEQDVLEIIVRPQATEAWRGQDACYEEAFEVIDRATGAFTASNAEQQAFLYRFCDLSRMTARHGIAILEDSRVVFHTAYETLREHAVRAGPDINDNGRDELITVSSALSGGHSQRIINIMSLSADDVQPVGSLRVHESNCGTLSDDKQETAHQISVSGSEEPQFYKRSFRSPCEANEWTLAQDTEPASPGSVSPEFRVLETRAR